MLQVTYASKPQAAGGPFLRSAPGKIIFGKQQLRQTLTPADSLVNSVSFKALNVFPGNAIQNAVIQTLSGTKYKVQPTFCVDYTQCKAFVSDHKTLVVMDIIACANGLHVFGLHRRLPVM